MCIHIHTYIPMYMYTHIYWSFLSFGKHGTWLQVRLDLGTRNWISQVVLLKIIGLFCKRALYKRLHSAKETYNFKEPTN